MKVNLFSSTDEIQNSKKFIYLKKIEKEISNFNKKISDTIYNPNYKLNHKEVEGLIEIGFLTESSNEEENINIRIEEYNSKIEVLEEKINRFELKISQIDEVLELSLKSNIFKGLIKNILSSEDSIKLLKVRYNILYSNKELYEYKPKLKSMKEILIDTLIKYKYILNLIYIRLGEIKKNHGIIYKVSKLGKNSLSENTYINKSEEIRAQLNSKFGNQLGFDNEELFVDTFEYITNNSIKTNYAIKNIEKVLLFINKNLNFTGNQGKSKIIFSIIKDGFYNLDNLNELKYDLVENKKILNKVHFHSISEETLFIYKMNNISLKYEQKNIKIFMLLKKIIKELNPLNNIQNSDKFEIALSIINNSSELGDLDVYINESQHKFIKCFLKISNHIEKYSCQPKYKKEITFKITSEIYKYPNYTEKYLEYIDEITEKIKYIGLSANNYKLDYVFGIFRLTKNTPEKLIDYIVQMENIIEEMTILGIGIHGNKYIIGLNLMKLGMKKKDTDINIIKLYSIYKELEKGKLPARIDKLTLSFRILVLSLNDKSEGIGNYFSNLNKKLDKGDENKEYNDAIKIIIENIKSRSNIEIDKIFSGGTRNKILSHYLKVSKYDINDYYLSYNLGEEVNMTEGEILIFEEEIKDSIGKVKSEAIKLEEEINIIDYTKKTDGMKLKDEIQIEEREQKSKGMNLSEEIKG